MITKKSLVLYVEWVILSIVLVALPNEAIASSTTSADLPQTTTDSTGFHSAFDTYVATEPGGYGVYEARQSNVFKPGETLLLYVEPAGMTYSPSTTTDGTEQLYNSKMTAEITISDSQGTVLAEIPNIPAGNIMSHHQNKEVFLLLSLDQESPFPTGDYLIKYVVRDDISGDSFEIVKDVVISG